MPKIKLNWRVKPEPKANYLAAVFRAYRKDKGITSKDMAVRLHCTPENCRLQMNKPADEWKIGKLKAYCDVLGIPYETALKAALQLKGEEISE